MTPYSVISVLIATYVCFVQGQSSCQTPNSGAGTCKSIYECEPLLGILNKPNKSNQDVDLLRKSACGFQGSAPKVCCPDPCFNADGQEGKCIGIYSCPALAEVLKPPVSQENLALVQNSRCQGPEQYSVCCANSPPVNNGNGNTCQLTAAPPSPRTKCCGRESGAGNRIVGGNSTTVDQYPWLTLIEYVKGNKIKLLCGGALISGKYVLTAGHCVTGSVLNSGTPRNIRLGEYDYSNEGADCTEVEGGGEDCTEGITVIPIDKTIPHPEYNPNNRLRRNDIALIRMTRVAPYTDFIRPICLPTTDLTLTPPAKFDLYAAGWGAVDETKSFSSVKLHVDLPFKSKDQCQTAYNSRNLPLWKGQLCAGGDLGKDSCKGDSGGPLMFENGKTWEVIGVVSFGPTPCGQENIPGVYTKVFEYNSWIRSQIKP